MAEDKRTRASAEIALQFGRKPRRTGNRRHGIGLLVPDLQYGNAGWLEQSGQCRHKDPVVVEPVRTGEQGAARFIVADVGFEKRRIFDIRRVGDHKIELAEGLGPSGRCPVCVLNPAASGQAEPLGISASDRAGIFAGIDPDTF